RERGVRVYDDVEAVPRRAYDVVINRHVLEHALYPPRSLWKMRRLLRPGGTLLLILPIEPAHWPPGDPATNENQHLYCWTPRTITNLLWRCGFRVQSVERQYPFGSLSLLPVRQHVGPKFYRALV